MFLVLPVSTNNLSSAIGFSLSWDLLILIGALVGVLLYGMMAGKNRLIGLILATYFSWAIAANIPWATITDFIGSKKAPSETTEVFLFLAFIVAIIFLAPRSLLGSVLRVGKSARGGSWFQIILFGVLEVGLLGAIILSILPAKSILALNPLIVQIFSGEIMRFVWFLAPILIMLFLGRGRGET
jgi:hypothetical protein